MASKIALNGVPTSLKRHLRSSGKGYQFTASHERARGLEEMEASTPKLDNRSYVYRTKLMGICAGVISDLFIGQANADEMR